MQKIISTLTLVLFVFAINIQSAYAATVSFGAQSEFDTETGPSALAIDALSSTTFVVAYTDGSDLLARVGTINGTGIDWGTEATVESPMTPTVIDVTRVTDTSFGIMYDSGGGNIYAEVCTTTISCSGSPVSVAGDTPNALGFDEISSSKLIAAWSDGTNAKARVVEVSSNTPNVTDNDTFTISTNNADDIDVAVHDAGSERFAVGYSEGSGVDSVGRIGTVSGDDISGFGDATELLDLDIADHLEITALSTSTVVYAFYDSADNSYLKTRVGSIDGTDISFPTAANTVDGNMATSYFDLDTVSSTSFLIAYQDANDSSFGNARVGDVSGTTITYGAEAAFEGAEAAQYIDVAAEGFSNSKSVVAFEDSEGSAAVGTITAGGGGGGAVPEFHWIALAAVIIAMGWYVNRHGLVPA